MDKRLKSRKSNNLNRLLLLFTRVIFFLWLKDYTKFCVPRKDGCWKKMQTFSQKLMKEKNRVRSKIKYFIKLFWCSPLWCFKVINKISLFIKDVFFFLYISDLDSVKKQPSLSFCSLSFSPSPFLFFSLTFAHIVTYWNAFFQYIILSFIVLIIRKLGWSVFFSYLPLSSHAKSDSKNRFKSLTLDEWLWGQNPIRLHSNKKLNQSFTFQLNQYQVHGEMHYVF